LHYQSQEAPEEPGRFKESKVEEVKSPSQIAERGSAYPIRVLWTGTAATVYR
jgi:hypothetical protein